MLRLDVPRVALEEQGGHGQQRVVGGVDPRLVAQPGGLHLRCFVLFCFVVGKGGGEKEREVCVCFKIVGLSFERER